MDKSSFFFASKCGACHPGGGSLQYDRDGNEYWDGTAFGYTKPGATGPADRTLDGDYGLISASGTAPEAAVPARWDLTGVAEADCLVCHASQYNWNARSSALSGAVRAGGPTLNAFSAAASAGAGFAGLTCATGGPVVAGNLASACTPQPGSPTGMATAVTINYAAAETAGLIVRFDSLSPGDQAAVSGRHPGITGGALLVKADWIKGVAKTSNCQGCHSTPDRKKSGRNVGAGDVHAAMRCVACHPAGLEAGDALEVHDIAKGDITIGGVDNHTDGKVRDCAECHMGGLRDDFDGDGDIDADDQLPGVAPPDPTAKHRALPGSHFSRIACNGCHIKFVDSPTGPGGTRPFPDQYIDHHTNGTQTTWSLAALFPSENPLDPLDTAGAPRAATYTRWYPPLYPHKKKNGVYASANVTQLTTVKPLLTSWFGFWNDETSELSIKVAPIPLRHVRMALTGNFNTATFSDPADTEAEIAARLLALENPVTGIDAMGVAPPSDWGFGAYRPALVRAGKIWYLDGAKVLRHFESSVAESHDFAVNHNVNPAANAYGKTGCADCHAPGSPFFHGKYLVDPGASTAATATYAPRYVLMGLSAARVDALTKNALTVLVTGGQGLVQSSEAVNKVIKCGDDGAGTSGTLCSTTPYLGATSFTLTAAAAPGFDFLGWAGACSGTGPCTVTVGGFVQVEAKFARNQVLVALTNMTTAVPGTVTSAPAGIDTAAGATYAYFSKGAAVRFTAAGGPVREWLRPPVCGSAEGALSGSTCIDAFAGCTPGSATCTVTVPAVPQTDSSTGQYKPALVFVWFQ